MLLLAPPLPAQPDLERTIDELLRQGYDRPDQAMAALQALELPDEPCGRHSGCCCWRAAWCWHRAAATPRPGLGRRAAYACAQRSTTPRPRPPPAWCRRCRRTTPRGSTWRRRWPRPTLDGLQPYCPPLRDAASSRQRIGGRVDRPLHGWAGLRAPSAWHALQLLQQHTARTGACGWTPAAMRARHATWPRWAGDDLPSDA